MLFQVCEIIGVCTTLFYDTVPVQFKGFPCHPGYLSLIEMSIQRRIVCDNAHKCRNMSCIEMYTPKNYNIMTDMCSIRSDSSFM